MTPEEHKSAAHSSVLVQCCSRSQKSRERLDSEMANSETVSKSVSKVGLAIHFISTLLKDVMMSHFQFLIRNRPTVSHIFYLTLHCPVHMFLFQFMSDLPGVFVAQKAQPEFHLTAGQTWLFSLVFFV